MKDEIGKEGLQWKKEHDALETRMEAKIESESREVQEELASMKDEMKNNQDGQYLHCQQCSQHRGGSRTWNIRPAASFGNKAKLEFEGWNLYFRRESSKEFQTIK